MNFITLPDIGKRIPLLEVSSSIELFTCAHWVPDGKTEKVQLFSHLGIIILGIFEVDNTYLMEFLAPAVEPRLIIE